MPGDPGEAICRPYSFRRLRSTSSSSTSITTSGPRLVHGRDDARRGVQPIRRVLDRDGVRARHTGDAPQVDDDAEQVDRFLEIRVAQVERADDLVLVLAALGRRVGDDGDRARRGHLVEVVRARCDRRQRVLERRVAQLGRDRRLPERRIEDDVEVGDARQCRDDVARAGLAEQQRRRQLRVMRQLVASELGMSRVRSTSASSCVLPSAGTAILLRTANRALRSSVSTSLLVGFSSCASSYSMTASSYLPVAASRRARVKCISAARSLARSSASVRLAIVGVLLQRRASIRRRRDRSRRRSRPAGRPSWGRSRTRSAPATSARRGRWPGRRHGGASGAQWPSVMTSTPRGITNTNSLSAIPAFSCRFVKENADVPPCWSAVTSMRSCRVARSTTRFSHSYSRSWRFGVSLIATEPAGASGTVALLDREVPEHVPLAREEQRRRRRLIVGRHGRDVDLLVVGDVRVDLDAVRHEDLFFGLRVGPAHASRLANGQVAVLDGLLAKDAARVAVREVGAEVADLIVVALDGRGELARVVSGQSGPGWQAYQQAAQKGKHEVWHGPPEREALA